METQSKFLSIPYLETRLKEIQEIKRGEMKYKIERSDRANSNSLYITFSMLNRNFRWQKYETLRISDHEQKNCIFPQFIVAPNDIMTKKKKQKFIGAIKKSVARAKIKFRIKALDKMGQTQPPTM